jgi:hypothetical protein
MGFMSAGLRSRRVRVLALSGAVLAASAVPAAAVTAGTYRGKSSQGHRVRLRVVGTQIRRLDIVWDAHCQGSSQPLAGLTTYHLNVPIRHNAWTASGSYSAPSGKGYKEYFSVKDHGTFVGKNAASGVFTGTARIYTTGAHPKFVTSCKSGSITFNLKRVL